MALHKRPLGERCAAVAPPGPVAGLVTLGPRPGRCHCSVAHRDCCRRRCERVRFPGWVGGFAGGLLIAAWQGGRRACRSGLRRGCRVVVTVAGNLGGPAGTAVGAGQGHRETGGAEHREQPSDGSPVGGAVPVPGHHPPGSELLRPCRQNSRTHGRSASTPSTASQAEMAPTRRTASSRKAGRFRRTHLVPAHTRSPVSGGAQRTGPRRTSRLLPFGRQRAEVEVTARGQATSPRFIDISYELRLVDPETRRPPADTRLLTKPAWMIRSLARHCSAFRGGVTGRSAVR